MYQTKAYARSCGVLEGDAKDGDCVGKNGEEMEEGDVGEAFVCFCTTDLCNKASGLISSSSYVYLVIPLLIYQVLWIESTYFFNEDLITFTSVYYYFIMVQTRLPNG